MLYFFTEHMLKEHMQIKDSTTHKSHKKPSIHNPGIILELYLETLWLPSKIV